MNDTNEDKSLFRKHFGDIERIHSDCIEKPGPTLGLRSIHILPQSPDIRTPISSHPELPPASEQCIDDYHFRREGIRKRLFRQLKRGQLSVGDTIDLHGMNREVALSKLQQFMNYSQRRGSECVLVVHGKGIKSEHQAVLKPSVPVWLKQMPEVLAYCPALPRHGGSGALYVLLRRGHR